MTNDPTPREFESYATTAPSPEASGADAGAPTPIDDHDSAIDLDDLVAEVETVAVVEAWLAIETREVDPDVIALDPHALRLQVLRDDQTPSARGVHLISPRSLLPAATNGSSTPHTAGERRRGFAAERLHEALAQSHRWTLDRVAVVAMVGFGCGIALMTAAVLAFPTRVNEAPVPVFFACVVLGLALAFLIDVVAARMRAPELDARALQQEERRTYAALCRRQESDSATAPTHSADATTTTTMIVAEPASAEAPPAAEAAPNADAALDVEAAAPAPTRRYPTSFREHRWRAACQLVTVAARKRRWFFDAVVLSLLIGAATGLVVFAVASALAPDVERASPLAAFCACLAIGVALGFLVVAIVARMRAPERTALLAEYAELRAFIGQRKRDRRQAQPSRPGLVTRATELATTATLRAFAEPPTGDTATPPVRRGTPTPAVAAAETPCP